MRHVLSPLTLVLLCWGLTGLGAFWALTNLDDLDLVRTFMMREGVSRSAFTGAGLSWILLGLLTYVVADFATQFSQKRMPVPRRRYDTGRAARMTFMANLVLLGVTALWIVTAAAKAGGVLNLAASAYADSLTARDILLENKLFTGMRLFYAALPATASLAAALLATGTLRRRARWMMRATLICNTTALFILPIVMSQRLLLLQLLLSAYIAACLVRRRLFGLHWVAGGILLFLGLWVLREAITNPIVQRPAIDIASQKLAFYLVNDMFNAFAPLGTAIPHTNGALTLEGIMFLTFTDGYFTRLLAPRMEVLGAVLGGGEFPFFTAAYVDFGPIGGVVFIALCAFVFRWVFMRARLSLAWAVIYAQIGATLLFSSHALYFVHQNFYFSAALVGLVLLLSAKRPRTGVKPPALVALFRTCRNNRSETTSLPDSLMRHMVVFESHRSRTSKRVRRPVHEHEST